jgi:outer membrane protein OmpU
MNKLKKVGLTALATTLVTSASFAGEMSVSGGASLNYSGLNTTSDANPWSMGDSVTFSGGGDLDNGMTVAVSFELDGGTYDDYSLTLGMGDMGSLTFSGNSVNAGGVDKVKDIVPTAYTPVYENTDTTDNGLATTSTRSTAGMWGYTYSADGLMISAGYNPVPGAAASAESSIGISYDGAMDGLTIVAGRFDDGDVAENDTYGVKYTMGSVTAAYQITKVEYDATTTADQDSSHMGISVAINENLTVSGGRMETEIDSTVEDEINSGVQASYTMGSITLAGGFNKQESGGGTAANDAEVAMFNAAFAF